MFRTGRCEDAKEAAARICEWDGQRNARASGHPQDRDDMLKKMRYSFEPTAGARTTTRSNSVASKASNSKGPLSCV
eukprot:971641-Pyramimonas_sp.AAC.2